jgi:protein required for attachment to host cells
MANLKHLLFVLTDGGRARLLERSPGDGHYVTIEEIDGSGKLQATRSEMRATPPGRANASASPRRSAVGPEDYLRDAKEAFIGEVADRAVAVCRQRDLAGVVIAAPPRLIGPLRTRLEDSVTVAGEVRKDLTKAPNVELGAWLNAALSGPPNLR